ncbi:MAG TPA: TolC family protein [Longimicrobiales bacterium]|nr:TolC family protein [Longimicrobiales bacterium]
MTRSMARLALAAVLVLLPAGAGAQQQPLTLETALARAERQAYGNRIARAQAEAAEAPALAALQGVLPTVRFEGGYLRTTDPIGAFGTTLRQRAIAPEDFDPARLNYPSAVSNYQAGVVLEQPLFNADAHLGRTAARRAADAADASAAWASVGTRVDVIRAYYGAVLAAEKTRTLEAAYRAARGHVAQAEKVMRAGLATRSDALLAEVKAGEVEAELIGARDEAELARRQLAVLLGTPEDTAFALPVALPSVASVRALLAAEPAPPNTERRADVRAARLGASAAGADVKRAFSLYLPRINGFARYDWNSANRLYGGDENWTVGVMASWTPFAGASEWAERRGAGGRAEAARAGLAAAAANASLEIERAAGARRVALARLDIAARAVRQSAEANRIVTRKYEGGLATVLELLDAAAVKTQSELQLAHTRYTGVVAAAEERRARGYDPAEVAGLVQHELVGIEP